MAGVVALGLLVIAAACGGEPREPTGLGGGPIGPPGQGGGGGGGSGSPGPLLGQWRNILILQVNGDFQRIETTWEFDNRNRCSRLVETFSVLEDRLHFSFRLCAYQVNANRLAVLYDDAQENVFFDFFFPDFTDDRVVIDQFEFFRLF